MKKSILGVTENLGVAFHNHDADEPCPGYPHCFKLHFSISSLADSLMKSTLGFANAKIIHPNQIYDFFNGAYRPAGIPKLKVCREIQAELRQWLTDETLRRDFTPNVQGPMVMEGGYEGLADKSPKFGHIVAEGISVRFGSPDFIDHLQKHGEHIASHGYSLEFAYRFVGASLEDLTGYGMAFLLQDDQRDKVGLCARENCGNIFIDLKSRGMPRKYCKTDECEKILAAERVAASRAKSRAAKRPKTKTKTKK